MCSAKKKKKLFAGVPGHEDVDKPFVSVEPRRDVFFDPLVDRLRGGIHFDLFQQLLFQLHEWEQEAQTLPFQNLQHLVCVLVNFYRRIYRVSSSKDRGQMNNSVGPVLPGSIFCMLILLCWKRSESQSRSRSFISCCRQSKNSGKCAPFSSWWAKSARLTRSAMIARAANWAR